MFKSIAVFLGMMRLLKKMKRARIGDSSAQMVPWVSPKNSNDFDNAVPRNSTLISTGILCITAIWFSLSSTLAETLLMNTLINLVLGPILVKWTVSSNMKSNVVVPSELQFHEDTEQGKFLKVE